MGKGRRPERLRKISKPGAGDLIILGQAALITIAIAFLFYRSILGVFSGILIIPFWTKLKSQQKEEERVRQLLLEFKEYMLLIVSGLTAGYSLERAIKQSESELLKLYPKNSRLLPYVHVMNQKITMNVQLERAFVEFARATGLEEAESLADIISFAKRSGGDYGKHIKDTAVKIQESIQVKQEIETITTEKRLELKVMSVMPMGILFYITLTSGSFIAPLYGNLVGTIIMTACLIAYGLLILLGRKIIDIKV
ncbi:MAG: hypothetical protein IKP29_00635 [Pseudobutyrivibrio sp.]|nr:hypothetical protein [Pseudobutyrivibrio sp.]